MIPKRQVVGAWLLLTGFCSLWLGVAWDGEWHVDVGPDTFFTAPHLMFYFGTALIGLTSLTVVLTGRGAESAGPTVPVLGFRPPVAFLVAGLGAAGHLLYGAVDLWWHTIYGFDLLESTPSHLSLQLAMQVQVVGVIMAFAVLRTTRSGLWGLAAAGALCVAASSIMLEGELFGLQLNLLGASAAIAWTLCVVVGIARSAWWLAAVGLLFVAVHAATFLFPPLATGLYADGIDQPLRDNAAGVSPVALAMPLIFPVMALLAALAVHMARQRALSPPATMAAVGAAVGLVVALYASTMEGATNWIPTSLVLAVLAALAGRLGWQSAALLRRQAVAA